MREIDSLPCSLDFFGFFIFLALLVSSTLGPAPQFGAALPLPNDEVDDDDVEEEDDIAFTPDSHAD